MVMGELVRLRGTWPTPYWSRKSGYTSLSLHDSASVTVPVLVPKLSLNATPRLNPKLSPSTKRANSYVRCFGGDVNFKVLHYFFLFFQHENLFPAIYNGEKTCVSWNKEAKLVIMK